MSESMICSVRAMIEPDDARPPTGGEDDGGGFFQRCLAKDRGSTPAQQRLWRNDIYHQIREMMSLQGSLSIERMCQMVPVSRRGFYRSLRSNILWRKRWKCDLPFNKSLWNIVADTVPANRCGVAQTGDAGQPQESGADHAGR